MNHRMNQRQRKECDERLERDNIWEEAWHA
jgi:hypothetical protein